MTNLDWPEELAELAGLAREVGLEVFAPAAREAEADRAGLRPAPAFRARQLGRRRRTSGQLNVAVQAAAPRRELSRQRGSER